MDIRDDINVGLWTIYPDGTYRIGTLEDGLGGGWTTFNHEGYEIFGDDYSEKIPVPIPEDERWWK